MPKLKRKRYTREFKEEAVRLLEKDSRSGEEIAEELGLDRGLLYRWKKQLRGNEPVVSGIGDPLSTAERVELRKLRKEVEQLREEREILKKATAFFAKESK